MSEPSQIEEDLSNIWLIKEQGRYSEVQSYDRIEISV